MPRRKKYTGDVLPKSRMFPMAEPERQNTATEPLVRRLDVAGAKLEKMQQQIEDNKGLTPKILRNLGKVTLEFEQVNNNLDSLRGTILRDMSAKRRFMQQERKLIKEEKKVIEETSQSISLSRLAFGAVAGFAAFDNLFKGDIGGFLGNSLLAGAANADIVSSIVGGLGLGALLRGRGAQTASKVTQGAGMSKGMGLMKYLKNPKIGIPLALLSLLGLSQMGKANASEPITSTGTGIDKKDLSRFDTLNQQFQAALVPLIKLTNKGNILASAMTDAQELNLSDEDYKWLAYGVSAEAARGTDDEHAVAASILNRVSSKHFPNSIKEVVLQENQYEAVTKERAFHDKKLQKQLSSIEGQDKIASALALLEGRTDFKGQSQLHNRVEKEDPMFDEKGNFYHYWWQQPGAVKPEGWKQPNWQQFMSINQDPDETSKIQTNNTILPMLSQDNNNTATNAEPPTSPGTGSLQCFPDFKSVDEFACNLLLGAGT